MEKRKAERPKLRKEDIGTPVNFVHVQHVGFGAGKPQIVQSASATPSFDNMDSFFNQQNVRRSDSSIIGNTKVNLGKENRFSNPPLPPYSSMSNLTIIGGYEKNAGVDSMRNGKQKTTKSSISGSLLNLSFFPFTKSTTGSGANEKPQNTKSDHESVRSKRLSLALPFQSPSTYSFPFFQNRSAPSPPGSSPPPPTQPAQDISREFGRRRSSSFNGESDLQTTLQKLPPKPIPSYAASTLNRHQISNKKPKMVTQLSLPSPPLSPTYDELPPPPPLQETFTTHINSTTTKLAESPSFVDLPPPPPMRDIIPRKYSGGPPPRLFSMPPPPPLPTDLRRKLSAIPFSPPATPNDDMDFPPPPSPSGIPPPLPTSLPPSRTNQSNPNGATSRNFPLRANKLVRVNAPTLPPLSVPLIWPKTQSPGTPNTWPLAPGVPELYYAESQDSGIPVMPPPPEYERIELPEEHELTIERMLKVCNTNSTTKCINFSHIEPLSKLFQCRLTYKQWPTMMEKLFFNSPDKALNDPAFTKTYNDLIQNTLDLWLKSAGGVASLENVVTAFEQTQADLSNDGEEVVTKL